MQWQARCRRLLRPIEAQMSQFGNAPRERRMCRRPNRSCACPDDVFAG
jgi:hypothetical protein